MVRAQEGRGQRIRLGPTGPHVFGESLVVQLDSLGLDLLKDADEELVRCVSSCACLEDGFSDVV